MIIKRNKTGIKQDKAVPQPEEQKQEAAPVFNQFQPQETFESFFPQIKERQERRRGDRRRGYRRIDDRNLISRAHEEANSIREEAAKEGFERGISYAKEEVSRLVAAIDEFLRAKEIAMSESMDDIAFIVMKVAEKLIKTEVACDETIVLNIVSEVLKEIKKEENNITIKTHPHDTQIVEQNLPKLFPYGNRDVKILVVSDDEVDLGSCIVETSNGKVDAKFSTQLQILQKAFETGI